MSDVKRCSPAYCDAECMHVLDECACQAQHMRSVRSALVQARATLQMRTRVRVLKRAWCSPPTRWKSGTNCCKEWPWMCGASCNAVTYEVPCNMNKCAGDCSDPVAESELLML